MLTSVGLIHIWLGKYLIKNKKKKGKSCAIFAVVEITFSFEDRLLILLPLCILHKQGYATLTNWYEVKQKKGCLHEVI